MDWKHQGRVVVSKREQNKRDKLARIIGAARALIDEQGFAQTTTQQVAERAGVAHGTLFLYVNTKEDLLTLAFAQEMGEVVTASFVALEASSGFVDQVYGFFAGIFSYHDKDIVKARELLREVGVLRDPARDYGVNAIPILSSLMQIVNRGIDNGDLRKDLDVEQTAHGLFALYWWALREWVHERGDSNACQAQLRELIDLLVTGIGSSPEMTG